MAIEQPPFLFFKPLPDVDPATVAQALLDESPSPGVVPLNLDELLQAVRKTRGFARLKVSLPWFNFENRRAEAALEGKALDTHLYVEFYGHFDKVAKPLFNALTPHGLMCYSVWDQLIVTEWPVWEKPTIDRGFAQRRNRILQRKTQELLATESDEERRGQILHGFANGPEFRKEMAHEARREPGRRKKAYVDLVDCYLCWKGERPSVAELGAARKLDAKLAAMSIAEFRAHIGDSPRLLIEMAVSPRHAAELRRSAAGMGLTVEIEPT